MHIFIKEMLYLLDYNDNILDTLFISTDKRTPGYAYEINIVDHNTGHSDLNFRMPCDIINKDGEKVKNPKLEMLKPLSKVRYNRQIIYQGKETIEIPDKGNTTITIPKNDGTHPEDYVMEDYVMDYIIQPLDKNRENIGIGLLYTAIDFPRFNLSKKKVGLTFDDKTIVNQDLSLYKNKPLSIPGSVQYLPWTANLMKKYQTVGFVENKNNLTSQNAQIGDIYYVITEQLFYQLQEDNTWISIANNNSEITWEPNPQTGDYPLSDASIKKLVKETDFSYGILSTIYYWPVTKTGRFQGVRYEKGGFITLSLYNTYEGSDWEGSDYLNSITWKWGVLSPMEHYLSPNNACNYLRYIIKDTNWKVKGDKDNFIINTVAQPWFNDGEIPDTGEENQYYVTIKELEEGYSTKIFRYEDGHWIDKTEDTFAQIVNMDKDDPDFGTLYDIDIEQVEVPRADKADFGNKILTDARYNLKVNNSNCYNAITLEAKLFDLYPIFDCINKTISLKLNVGADYGLTYRFKENLKNSNVKVDGEKVITKLYVTGGTDANGSKGINLGEATRSINGVNPTLVSNNGTAFDVHNMDTEIEGLEQNAYNNLNGIPLSLNIDMSNQAFKLEIPDNLYELKYTESQLNQSSTRGPEALYSFSSGKSIDLLYNPTGTDYCFYIYLNDGADSYKDESKQLYKFDYSNRTLRRNLETIEIPNIGTVSEIDTNIKTQNNVSIVNYIKYSPLLNDIVYKDGNVYKGNVIKSFDNSQYNIDTDLTQEFVLAGPDRVFVIHNNSNEEKQYNYQIGKYYYRERDGKFLYCLKMNTDSGSKYSKINTISINGYILIELGIETDPLILHLSNGTNSEVHYLNDEPVLLQDWFSNNFALRVKYSDTCFKEVDNFNPNNQEYLMKRSPYGETYIYNFKYLYDNGWMTKEQILDIYRISALINDLNLDFYERYTKDLVNTRAKLDDAINNQEIYSSKADAQLDALMSLYWINPNKASDGQIYAFPGVPKDATYDSNKKKYYVDITYPDMPNKRVYFNVFDGNGFNELYPHAKDNKTISSNPESEGQYHVVAKALGWNNYKKNKLTINTELNDYTEAQDPSKTAESYNDFIKHMKEYYYRAYKAEVAIEEANQDIKDLADRYKEWEKQRALYEKYLQEHYSQYLIEGSYSNQEQPYANLLLEEGLEASDKYATPDITYSIGVVDASGLIEYRAPQVYLCNKLVKRLHNLGQIAPHVGDYVAIQDEPMGMFGVPGLITQISRRIDNPYQNNITIDTSYSDADELVGNIITATNTVLSNKDIYGRMAIVNNKGELSSTAVNNALSTGEKSISIVSTNGKITVDDNGLTCINPHDNNGIIKYNGTGILTSQDAGVSWTEMLNQDGINANYIKSGTINAGKVSITDGGNDVTILNGDGLAVKSNPGQPYKVGSMSSHGISESFDNLTVFIGRDKNGEGVGYFNGYIDATKGGWIGDWRIDSDGLYKSNNQTYLSATGYQGYSLKVNDNFKVETDGTLHAKEAIINGSGSFSGDITANSLTLGSNVKVDESHLEGMDDYLQTDKIVQVGDTSFKVSKKGLLEANNAVIKGTIYAKEGNIGGWSIEDGFLGTFGEVANTVFLSKDGRGAYINQTGTSPSCVLYTRGNFAVDTEGRMYATNANMSGSISGSTISGGSINITKGGYYFKMGVTTNNPEVSGLNVTGGKGININNLGFNSDGSEFSFSGGVTSPYITANTQLYSPTSSYLTGDVHLNNIKAGGRINLLAGAASGNASGGGILIRSRGGHVSLDSTDNGRASGHYVYARGNDLSNAKVKTDSGSASSRNTKKNFKKFTNSKYDKALELLNNIDIYSYDYKYDLYENKKQYGFIIDEIEKQKDYQEFFDFRKEKAKVDGEHLDFCVEDDDDGKNIIEVKKYNEDTLDKYLLTCIKGLQQEVEDLKIQIKKEKIN